MYDLAEHIEQTEFRDSFRVLVSLCRDCTRFIAILYSDRLGPIMSTGIRRWISCDAFDGKGSANASLVRNSPRSRSNHSVSPSVILLRHLNISVHIIRSSLYACSVSVYIFTVMHRIAL